MTGDRELFEERAAIREFDAGTPRLEAELLAANDVETIRHRSEVRWCCAHPSRVAEYVADVRRKRGDESADRLLADSRSQWAAGNRGRPGEWRDA